jgi:hypothetical protein
MRRGPGAFLDVFVGAGSGVFVDGRLGAGRLDLKREVELCLPALRTDPS